MHKPRIGVDLREDTKINDGKTGQSENYDNIRDKGQTKIPQGQNKS